MTFFSELYNSLTGWLVRNLASLSMAFVATILVVYGDSINRSIRKNIRHNPFVIRLLIFVAVCAFGYGTLTVFSAWLVEQILDHVPKTYLCPVLIVLFFAAGMLAEREKQL